MDILVHVTEKSLSFTYFCALTEIVAKLLEAKADVTIARKDGVTALHIAAQNGHRAVCQLLINNEHGAKGKAVVHFFRVVLNSSTS